MRDRVRTALPFYDTNGDGDLDRRRLRSALRHYGLDATAGQAARVLDAYDERPDRKLDVVEFSNLVQDIELGVMRSAAEGRMAEG